MKLDFSEIARTPGARVTHSFSEQVPESEGLVPRGPFTGTLTVTNTGLLLLVEGRFSGEVELPCGRCLEPYVSRVEATISEQFSAAGPLAAAENETIEAEEPEAAAYQNYELDLTELLRQQMLISLPMRPLCREECRGLCPTCGANLNTEQCDCAVEEPESPLGKLKSLLERHQ